MYSPVSEQVEEQPTIIGEKKWACSALRADDQASAQHSYCFADLGNSNTLQNFT
jgi:hypothetical protein